MELTLWRYELRRLGPAALGVPLLALAAVGLIAWLSTRGSTPQPDRILSAGLDVLPLAAGVTAADVVGRDAALELQLSLPTTFRATVLRRLLLAMCGTGLLGGGATVALAATGRLAWPIAPAAAQLIWLAPTLWLATLGAATGLALRSVAAGCGLVGACWLGEQLAAGFFRSTPWHRALWLFLRPPVGSADAWYGNRACLLVGALALSGLVLWLLGRAEYLLGGEE